MNYFLHFFNCTIYFEFNLPLYGLLSLFVCPSISQFLEHGRGHGYVFISPDIEFLKHRIKKNGLIIINR